MGLTKPLHVGIGGRGWGGWGGREQGHSWVVTIVREKRGEGCEKMLGIVVGEFCQGEETGLVGLLVVAVHAQILLHHRVEPLHPAIRPRVERRGEVGANPTEF